MRSPDWGRLQRQWENERAQEIKDLGCFMGDAWRGGYAVGLAGQFKTVELSFPSRADLDWERVRRNYEHDPRYSSVLATE